MKMKAPEAVTLLIGMILVMSFGDLCHGDLQVGFYNGECGFQDVELIVGQVIAAQVFRDPTTIAALLRLQFHDCFVRGCDASILLDGFFAEKTAAANFNLRGFDVIDQAKAAVERACPGVVSCADIIAMAARDAVFLGGGGRDDVETGRRDGIVSAASEVVDLLGPSISVTQAIKTFAMKGLSIRDMVLLLGAHTVGVAHCSFFQNRLFNFQNTGKPDPTMDPFLATVLMFTCPENGTKDDKVSLDQNALSRNVIDNSYYKQLMIGRGILKIDQELALDPQTRDTVISLANTDVFNSAEQFGEAMIKLGAVEVLTGKKGEIRRLCHAINN